MSERFSVFFYGLFMDEALLRERGAAPDPMRHGTLSGFELRVGARATLVRKAGAIVHGMLTELSQAELDELYAGPLHDYRPQVVAVDVDRSRVAAICYTLPWTSATASDPNYAAKLRALAQRLGFPEEYVALIR